MSSKVPTNQDTRPQHHLPAEIASFVGRERELAEIKRILAQARLLTLFGAGGSGKTRLALRVAADLAPTFADGVWLVQLAPLTDSAMVPRAVAAALDIHGTGGRALLTTLAAALASRRMLLVLDNCEHLIGACARLAETLLRACPELRVLCTSREPLRVPGETTWRVPSLGLPDTLPEVGQLAALETLRSLAQVESVALFLARACARRPDFALTARNAPSIVAICRHMDGLPLGIELAAAHVSALAPEQIAARLGNALNLLRGGSRTLPRHETLRAMLDWSYALLSPAEAALFRRLAVFAGGFDLAAAEGVRDTALASADVLPLVAALVEKSLVETVAQQGEARFRLLEPVRQYAWERLEAHGEADDLRRQHAHYFMELAGAAKPWLMSAKRGLWLERLATDEGNLRAALAWSRHRAEDGDARDGEVGLRLAEALAMYWVYRGDVSEGREWIEGTLTKCQDVSPNVRADALHMAGELAWLMGQYPNARARLEASATIYRALGDRRGLAYVLQVLPMVIEEPQASEVAAEALRLFEEVGDAWGEAHAAMTQAYLALESGDPTEQEMLEASLARWRALGDDWGMAMALNYLGDLARRQGEVATATARYQESLGLLRRQNMPGTVPSLLHNLGYLALRGGDARRALRLFREGLTLFRNQGDQRGIAECLAGVAGALGALKQPERAARLLGAAEALFEEAGAAMSASNAADYARTRGVVHGQLDGPALAAVWAEGRTLGPERAIAEALEAGQGDARGGVTNAPQLTARERQVAALVARGMTNRQIGHALVITEGTARLHVKHILAKLEFASRAQIAGWAVEHGLAEAPDA